MFCPLSLVGFGVLLTQGTGLPFFRFHTCLGSQVNKRVHTYNNNNNNTCMYTRGSPLTVSKLWTGSFMRALDCTRALYGKMLKGSQGQPCKSKDLYMSYSLNSLKGDYIGDYIGDYYRGY